MNSKERRKDIRLDLSDPCFVMIEDNLYEVNNISNNGLFFKCNVSEFEIGQIVLVEILLPDSLGNMFVEGKIVRAKWNNLDKKETGLGLKFINFRSKTFTVIKSYVTYLRNKQIIKVARMIVEEYLGKNNDKSR